MATTTCKVCGEPAEVTTDPRLYDSVMDSGSCVVVRHQVRHLQGCINGPRTCVGCGTAIALCLRPIFVRSGQVSVNPTVLKIWMMCNACREELPGDQQAGWRESFKAPADAQLIE